MEELLAMNILSYFLRQKVYQDSSIYNNDIAVYLYRNKPSLYVNKISQTGPYLQYIFTQAFKRELLNSKSKLKEVLVLGVGGGFVISYLQELGINIHIDAVDLDVKILSIAQKYFHLKASSKLEFICNDALYYINKSKKHYNLVVVDLFVGDEIPTLVFSDPFIKKLSSSISADGKVFINFQDDLRYRKQAKIVRQLLHKYFTSITEIVIERNLMFVAENRFV